MYDMTRSFAFTAFAPTGKPLFGGVERTATSSPAGLAGELWRRAASMRCSLVGSCADGWRSLREVRRAGVEANPAADALSLTAPAQSTISVQADGRFAVIACQPAVPSVGSYRLPA